MQVSYAIEPASGQVANEDAVVAAENFVCLLDGATVPAPLPTGCEHGTAWFVRRLSARILDVLTAEPAGSLPDLLAGAIERVRGDHDGRCDLDHPGTPASTVCMVRAHAGRLDYLILCDSPLVLGRAGSIDVVTDLRLQRSSRAQRQAVMAGAGTVGSEAHWSNVRALTASQRRYRNVENGFWIAAADPAAARQAVTGSAMLEGPDAVTHALLLTDGASRAVDTFSLTDCAGLLTIARQDGPVAVIRMVREAERADPDGVLFPRGKRHDDAAAAYCVF